MIDYLDEYRTVFDENLNTDLMNRVYDKPLKDCILECWRSLEIVKGITILDYEFTDRESQIDINKFIMKRERGKKKDEKYEYKYIDDSRLGLLTTKIKIDLEYIDVKDNEKKHETQIINKSMLIPLQDSDGRYFLNGKKVYLMFQLVEKSTYTAPNAAILKSLMPFAIHRYSETITDTNDETFTVPRYTLELFRKDVDIMLIYATKGMNFALQFALGLPYVVMDFVEEEDEGDLMNRYFRISSTLLLKVDRKMFDNFIFIRSLVGSIMNITTNRFTMEMLDDPETWLKKLGTGNPARGKNLLERANRLLDETTFRILKLDRYHKHDIYTLTRWMCLEYNDLRLKDNMNLDNKRLRSNEIFSALFTFALSFRLNGLMSLGKKATMSNYKDLFGFPGDRRTQLCRRKTSLIAGNFQRNLNAA